MALATFLTAWMPLSAQTRLPLEFSPLETALRPLILPDGRVRIGPVGPMRPASVLESAEVPGLPKWKLLPAGRVNAEDGSVTLDSTNAAAFLRARYPELRGRNYFLRIPTGADTNRSLTLCVVLHPYISGSSTAGQWMENDLGPWLDAYGLLTLFPTAQLVSGGVSWWNGMDGPRASDFAALEAGIIACRRLVPAITAVAVVAYSQGGSTAVGLTHLRPGLVDRLLVIGGQDNPVTARYVEGRAGGIPVRWERPIQTVFVAATVDTGALGSSRAGAAWMGRAHGYWQDPVALAARLDMHSRPVGLDSTVWTYGPHVQFIQTGAPDHDNSLYFTDPAFDMLYRDFVRDGTMPGKP